MLAFRLSGSQAAMGEERGLNFKESRCMVLKMWGMGSRGPFS